MLHPALVDEDLSSAVQLYFCYGAEPFPHEDAAAVRARYGSVILTRVEKIVQDAGCLKPDWRTHSLSAAKDWAETEMRRRYPELNATAVSALGWAFSYWWK